MAHVLDDAGARFRLLGDSLGTRDVDTIVLCLAERAPEARRSAEEALRELRHARLQVPRWRVVAAPDVYVAGEQTAAIRRASGKAAKPALREVEPHERGVGGRYRRRFLRPG